MRPPLSAKKKICVKIAFAAPRDWSGSIVRQKGRRRQAYFFSRLVFVRLFPCLTFKSQLSELFIVQKERHGFAWRRPFLIPVKSETLSAALLNQTKNSAKKIGRLNLLSFFGQMDIELRKGDMDTFFGKPFVDLFEQEVGLDAAIARILYPDQKFQVDR